MNSSLGDFKPEIEFKWQVKCTKDFTAFLNAVRRLGVSTGRAQLIRIHDIYLDTPEQFFAFRGIRLRLRRADSKWEYTIKTHSRLVRGFVKRFEKNVTLPASLSRSVALARCEALLAGSKKLVPVFEIKNKRMARCLALSGKTKAELSFDDLFMWRGSKRVWMKEIELEFKSGNFKALEVFAARLTRDSGLRRTRRSKVATAVAAFSLRPKQR